MRIQSPNNDGELRTWSRPATNLLQSSVEGSGTRSCATRLRPSTLQDDRSHNLYKELDIRSSRNVQHPVRQILRTESPTSIPSLRKANIRPMPPRSKPKAKTAKRKPATASSRQIQAADDTQQHTTDSLPPLPPDASPRDAVARHAAALTSALNKLPAGPEARHADPAAAERGDVHVTTMPDRVPADSSRTRSGLANSGPAGNNGLSQFQVHVVPTNYCERALTASYLDS